MSHISSALGNPQFLGNIGGGTFPTANNICQCIDSSELCFRTPNNPCVMTFTDSTTHVCKILPTAAINLVAFLVFLLTEHSTAYILLTLDYYKSNIFSNGPLTWLIPRSAENHFEPILCRSILCIEHRSDIEQTQKDYSFTGPWPRPR